MTALSVIICTRNRPQDVETCLPTVLACAHPSCEVLLVDQSTDDATRRIAETLRVKWPHLTHVPTDTVGKSVALDIGIARATGDILAFTDDDCEVPLHWLETITSEFAGAPTADILFGPVAPSPAIANRDDICVPAWVFTEARDLRPGEVCGMGANMALRRAVLNPMRPKLFDPLLGPGAPFPAGEEGDFVYRLRKKGARAALRPAMQVWHRAFRLPAHWQDVLRGYGTGDGAFHAKHARCGDLWAIGRIAQTLTRTGLRALVKSILRRAPNSDLSTLRGYWQGLVRSAAYPIDKKTRLYALLPAAETADTKGDALDCVKA